MRNPVGTLLGKIVICASLSILATTSLASTAAPTVSAILNLCPKSDEPNYTEECTQLIGKELIAAAIAGHLIGGLALGRFGVRATHS